MPIEIAPDPPPGERRALVEALAVAPAEPDGTGRSAWWREGVREALREAAGHDRLER